MTDFQIQRLLQERRLEDYAAVDSELVGFLEKAVRAIADAQAGISEEGAFLRAYEATFLCATAAILNAGYRTRGSAEGHHHDPVLGLRHLGVPTFADPVRRRGRPTQQLPNYCRNAAHIYLT